MCPSNFSALVRVLRTIKASRGFIGLSSTPCPLPRALDAPKPRGVACAAIILACLFLANHSQAQNLAWVKGSNVYSSQTGVSESGVYGTQGVAAPENTPGGRYGHVSWGDSAGNLWVFGGHGLSVSGRQANLNDLWKYDAASGNWTWMKGSNEIIQGGTYGTQGVAASGNTPGAREGAVSWSDSAGNLWLFGGIGRDHDRSPGHLNDLWKYDIASGNWTWMKGSAGLNQFGTYGTQGIAAAGNTPGARRYPVSWSDNTDNLWLFGGSGYATSAGEDALNDLWKYDVASGNWTWVKGSSASGQLTMYGTQGVAASSNMPGSRDGSASCVDSAGNLWFFGGNGEGAITHISLNDLWKYDVASGNWTWMKGRDDSLTNGQFGVYGTQGAAAPGNMPGERRNSVLWGDSAGNLWLFSGIGRDHDAGLGHLNDLWKYDIASGNWTWMKGSNDADQSGTYGTQGVAAPGNIPHPREYGSGNRGPANTLYLFGGSYMNDLWVIDLNPSGVSAVQGWTAYD